MCLAQHLLSDHAIVQTDGLQRGSKSSQINGLFARLLIVQKPLPTEQPSIPSAGVSFLLASRQEQGPAHNVNKMKRRVCGKAPQKFTGAAPVEMFDEAPGFSFLNHKILEGVKQPVRRCPHSRGFESYGVPGPTGSARIASAA